MILKLPKFQTSIIAIGFFFTILEQTQNLHEKSDFKCFACWTMVLISITRITLPYFVTFSLTSETLLLLIPEYSQNYKADKSSENGKHHEMMTSWQSFE